MFSIHLAEPEGRHARRRGIGERMLGKVLGFVAGLTLIVAADLLFLHGQLLHGVSDSLAVNQPALSHKVQGAWAFVAGR